MGLFGNMFGSDTSSASAKPNLTVARSAKLVQDPSGVSAVGLDKVEQAGGVSLRKKVESVGVSLKKHNVAGIRAQVVLVLDHSGSMHSDYASGAVQELTERFLAFGLQVDVDGEIPVVVFDHRTWRVDVNMSNYKGIVQDKIWKGYDMGSTDLARALREIEKLAQTTDAPLFVGVVTDGNPDSQSATTSLVCDLARYPVFIKFLALRDVPYLDMLDDLGDDKRLLDNVDAKTFRNLNISDEEFADAMIDEWGSWVKLALEKGVLTQ